MNYPQPPHAPDWFDTPHRQGLRFQCTQCGNCCSGPPGYVSFTDDEARALAAHLGLSLPDFIARFTHDTPKGLSLNEVEGPHGLDCVFLDRTTTPGRATCSVYAHRPLQCRTWPFWPSNLTSEAAWRRAARTCPGIDAGPLHAPKLIRLTRDQLAI